jgi:hypothetical protein
LRAGRGARPFPAALPIYVGCTCTAAVDHTTATRGVQFQVDTGFAPWATFGGPRIPCGVADRGLFRDTDHGPPSGFATGQPRMRGGVRSRTSLAPRGRFISSLRKSGYQRGPSWAPSCTIAAATLSSLLAVGRASNSKVTADVVG